MVRTKHHETAVLAVTDVHYGKQTASYNPEASRRQMEHVCERVASLVDTMKRGYTFDKLRLFLLGDGPDGDGIYPTQPHHQAISNAELQSLEYGREILVPLVKGLKSSFPAVEVDTVAGNHGRTGKSAHEAANWDVIAYRYAAADLRKTRGVTFEVEPVLPAVKVVEIRGHRMILYHGHGVKSYQGIPFYGLRQRALNWQSTKIYQGFEVIHVGHFHTFGRMQHNNMTIMLNGTMVSDDEWALQELGYESDQLWHFHGVSDSRAITFDFGVESGPEEAEELVA